MSHWPPRCGMPDCTAPGLVGSGRYVDFGTAGVRYVVRLCARHAEAT